MNESLQRGIGPLPNGLLSVHSDAEGVGVIVSTLKPDKLLAEKVVNGINTPLYQRETFYSPLHPRHRFSREFPDTSSVVFYDQSAKYSDMSALVIAKGPNTFERDENKLVPVEFIYDFPNDVQQTYWQFLLGGMKTFQEQMQDMKGARVFIGENNIATYSTSDNRTSRSIGNPHAHIVGFLEEHVEPQDAESSETVQYLKEEQEFTKRLSPHIARRVQTRLSETPQSQLKLSPQEEPPFGYSFTIPYTIDEIISNPKAFTELMADHHHAYAAVAKQMEKIYAPIALAAGFKQFIPQPSYRLYLEEIDGQLIAAISPEYLSHAGIMEAASYSLILDRDPSHPQRLSLEQVRHTQQDAVQYLENILTAPVLPK